MTDYARAQVQSERAQAAAEYKDLIEQHAAELEALREAAHAYRSVLYGAEIRGSLDASAFAELQLAEDAYADRIDNA